MKCSVASSGEGKSCPPWHRAYALCIMMLFVLTACTAQKEPPKALPSVPVTVATSVRKNMPLQVRAIGNVEPINSVTIKAQVNGQLSRVHFREGQDVRKGDLLFTIDPRPFEAALRLSEAALAKDRAQAAFSREQVRRYGSLLKDGIVTQDQYDQLRANADSFDAATAADRAAVDNARLQLAYCFIRSPIDGRTGNLLVQPGNLVKANDVPVLVTINQLSPIFVTFTVPEKEMQEIRSYLSGGTLKVEAVIPNDPKGPETGAISFLDNTVDTATGTIKLKGTFANKTRRLWPGQFVNVTLTLTTRTDAVVVPTQAVQTGQQGQFVFVVKPDLTVESRPVAVGLALGDESVIEKGLNAGEKVVTDGQLRLIPGAKVEVRQGPASGVLGIISTARTVAASPDTKR
jgi:multidrug efflux system membrane fusion protein